MGANNIKNVSDIHPESHKDPSSSAMYKPHLSPTRDTFYTPLGSPEQTPISVDTGPAPEDRCPSSKCPVSLYEQNKGEETWGAPFSRAMERIQRVSEALGQMHNQLGALLSPRAITEGPRIMDSAIGWEARLGEVRKDLSTGLKEMGLLKQKYEALSAGETMRTEPESGHVRYIQTANRHKEWLSETDRTKGELQESHPSQTRASKSSTQQLEETAENEILQGRIHQLEKEKRTLTEKVTELKGEVRDLNLLQCDLHTAVLVAERFREEAQEKLEKAERENRRLRGKGYDTVDWTDSSPVNGTLPGYHSLPRGVILSSMRDPVIKSSSLMSVPPSQAPQHDTGSGSRKERRGSLETLLNESKATENLIEDSGSFFRRYGGSKRGVFLRWAQDRTCGYKHVVITNFSSSWADGMALCALLHSYLPQSIPYAQLRPLEKRKNLQLAFQVAESVGIPPLLTPDHMLQSQGPDWQKVLLYVESIYQKFEA
ncbi:cytospin-A-like [Pelobates fuscus]|uniref:cytospin-A-like n=1 Tax=Pelobates fuscus TaxID=191477 RepID=UPI002FE4C3F7